MHPLTVSVRFWPGTYAKTFKKEFSRGRLDWRAQSVPMEVSQTGTRGAEDGASKES